MRSRTVLDIAFLPRAGPAGQPVHAPWTGTCPVVTGRTVPTYPGEPDPFAATLDGTDSVVARTEAEALAADRMLTEGDRLARRSPSARPPSRPCRGRAEHGGDRHMPALLMCCA